MAREQNEKMRNDADDLHGFGKSRTRFWVRWGQEIIRFIAITDYSQCDADHEPRTYYKRLTHERMRPGHELMGGDYDQQLAEWYATAFPAGQWCEIVPEYNRSKEVFE
jgi:hypothetical protein